MAGLFRSILMASPNDCQELFGPNEGTKEAWHCAIHGTVTSCPFRFLRCDDLPSSQDAAPSQGRGWLALARKHQASKER